MNLRSNRLLLAAAALVAGAGIGAAIYASVGPGGTTTVLDSVTTVDRGQQVSATTGLTVTEIYQRTYQGVVDVKVGEQSSFSFGRGGSQNQRGEGSGFVYDGKGNIVTNQHVVDGASTITVKFWNGATYKAHVVGTDPSTDVAVIKISAPKSLLHALTLGDSSSIQVGAGVVAIGSPFGYAESVTSGIISALHRTMTSPNRYTIADSIQTDAPINHGNSGGPLLNAQGQVIGVNAQIESNSGGNDGVGFAIPSNTVRSVASKLVSGKQIRYAYLGIGVDDATTADNAAAGALVGSVHAGTPSARAGLQAGDVVVSIAGNTIASAEDLTRVISSKQPGDSVAVVFVRNGHRHTVQIKLGTRPSA
jgi:putative serine protease PepD